MKMSNNALVICWRGLAEVWHQKKLVAFLIAYPLIFMVVFGSAFGGESTPISVDMAIVVSPDAMNDTLTESFIDIFQGYDGIDVTLVDATEDEAADQAKKIIDEEGVIVVLFIPSDFSTIVSSSVDIALFYDEAADLTTQNIVIGAVMGIIDGFSQNISAEKINWARQYGNMSEEEAIYVEGIAQPINTVVLGISPFEKKKIKFITFLVPGLVAMSIMWTGVTGTASALVEDRVRGIRRRILSTPTSRISILLGDIFSNVVLMGVQIIILLLVAYLFYGLSIVGHLWLVALIILVGMFSMISIGIVISSFTKTAEEANQLGMLVNFPMMFLGGVFFPISEGWMYYISRIFPLTYINEALRDVMIRGFSLQEVAVPFFISVIFAIGIFAFGFVMLLRREET
ncbi:MAG: ABC transporter permease [Candidatus Methanofastidiosia archaeon]